MTKQEYFDLLIYTSEHGGFPSIAEDGTCAYLSENGKQCAIGISIPKDVYHFGMEGKIVSLLQSAEVLFKWTGCTVDQLILIQTLHDCLAVRDLDSWDHAEFVARVKLILHMGD